MNLINNIFIFKNIIYVNYLKYIIFIVILLPLILNSLIYYLLIKVEKTGKINTLVVDKYLPSIFKRFFDYINYLSKNKELLNYYKGSCKAEIYFYIFILILYLFLLNFIFL